MSDINGSITGSQTGHAVILFIIKDKVLLTVACPIFPPFYIDSQISVHRKFKKIDQLIFRNAKEIYFNEKFPILYLFTLQNRNKLEIKF
jgi:hypothetical protein